jgi:hypothetical protein
VEWIRIDVEDYAEFAAYFVQQRCDVFIAPLLDNVFNRYKSPIKFLEYSAHGAPGVYSRITPYEAVISHGCNGFLASDPEEWQTVLVRLIEDQTLRQSMGEAAQQTVRQSWMLSAHVEKWREVYQQVQALPPRPSLAPDVVSALWKAHTWYDALTQQLAVSQHALRERERELDEMRASLGWQLLQALWPLRLWAVPPGSRREHLAQAGVGALRRMTRVGEDSS